jgi:hypothetical protein
LERLQRSADGARPAAHRAEQGHVLARQWQRQAGPAPEVQQGGDPVTIKGVFNLALRQATGRAQSLLKLAGADWQVPDVSTVTRRQKHLSVTIGAQLTTTELHLLVDSAGIKMLGEGEWKTKKHGVDCRR